MTNTNTQNNTILVAIILNMFGYTIVSVFQFLLESIAEAQKLYNFVQSK